MHRAKNDFYQL